MIVAISLYNTNSIDIKFISIVDNFDNEKI